MSFPGGSKRKGTGGRRLEGWKCSTQMMYCENTSVTISSAVTQVCVDHRAHSDLGNIKLHGGKCPLGIKGQSSKQIIFLLELGPSLRAQKLMMGLEQGNLLPKCYLTLPPGGAALRSIRDLVSVCVRLHKLKQPCRVKEPSILFQPLPT